MDKQNSGGSITKNRAPTYTFALILTTSLYALWGMAHNLNDILIAQFKRAFALTDLQSSLVQSCFYIAYLIMPIPVALFLQRFGYKRGVIAGLCLYALGALLFWPAAETVTYGAFLAALFVIACGLTFLETSGTGIIVTLGPSSHAEWRINLAQAFNPIGAIIGVLVGRQFIFSSDEQASASTTAVLSVSAKLAAARAVQMPYLGIALAVIAIAALVAFTRFPESATKADRGSPFSGLSQLLRAPLFIFGLVAQFFYVGSQIGVWSFLIRYVEFSMPGFGAKSAALVLTLSLILFLVGRFSTLLLLKRYSSAQIGSVFAVLAVVLTGLTIIIPNLIGVCALAAVSFFMSIMFPAIYAIGLNGNEAHSKSASALMIMTIVGGAVLTRIMGTISDHFNIAAAYVVPCAGFVIVGAYCFTAVRLGHVGKAAAVSH